MTAILGISAFYHDSAAALVVDGQIVAAAQEERFTRNKHDPAFPAQADRLLPARGGAVAGRPRLRRVLRQAADQVRAAARDLPGLCARAGSAASGWPCRSGSRTSCTCGGRSAAAWAARPARGSSSPTTTRATPPARSSPRPFDEAAILTLDGVGEWTTATFGVGEGNRIRLIDHIAFPHSLGLLYSAFTYYCGFKVNSGEYKLMGLAPYGRPIYRDADPRAPDRPQARRQLLAGHGLLQLLPGADDDQPPVPPPLRRPAAAARVAAGAAAHGPGRQHPGRDRGGHAPDRPPRARRRPA